MASQGSAPVRALVRVLIAARTAGSTRVAWADFGKVSRSALRLSLAGGFAVCTPSAAVPHSYSDSASGSSVLAGRDPSSSLSTVAGSSRRCLSGGTASQYRFFPYGAETVL